MPAATETELGEGIVAQALLELKEGLVATDIEADARTDRHRGIAAVLPTYVATPLGSHVQNFPVIEGAQAVLDGVVLPGSAGLPAKEAGGRRKPEAAPSLAHRRIEEIARRIIVPRIAEAIGGCRLNKQINRRSMI